MKFPISDVMEKAIEVFKKNEKKRIESDVVKIDNLNIRYANGADYVVKIYNNEKNGLIFEPNTRLKVRTVINDCEIYIHGITGKDTAMTIEVYDLLEILYESEHEKAAEIHELIRELFK